MSLTEFFQDIRKRLQSHNLHLIQITPLSFTSNWQFISLDRGIEDNAQGLVPQNDLEGLQALLKKLEIRLYISAEHNTSMADNAFRNLHANMDWNHMSLALIVYDRMCWVLANKANLLRGDSFIPHIKYSRVVNEQRKDPTAKWRGDVQRLCRLFKAHPKAQAAAQSTLLSRQEVNSSLAEVVLNASSGTRAMMESRFCHAAMGINALVAAGYTYLNTRSYAQHLFGEDTTPKQLMNNWRFLSPCYTAFVYGPVVLISSGITISVSSNGSTSLKQLARHVSVDGNQCPITLQKINYDLFILLLDLANEGAGILSHRFHKLIQSWTSLGVVDTEGLPVDSDDLGLDIPSETGTTFRSIRDLRCQHLQALLGRLGIEAGRGDVAQPADILNRQGSLPPEVDSSADNDDIALNAVPNSDKTPLSMRPDSGHHQHHDDPEQTSSAHPFSPSELPCPPRLPSEIMNGTPVITRIGDELVGYDPTLPHQGLGEAYALSLRDDTLSSLSSLDDEDLSHPAPSVADTRVDDNPSLAIAVTRQDSTGDLAPDQDITESELSDLPPSPSSPADDSTYPSPLNFSGTRSIGQTSDDICGVTGKLRRSSRVNLSHETTKLGLIGAAPRSTVKDSRKRGRISGADENGLETPSEYRSKRKKSVSQSVAAEMLRSDLEAPFDLDPYQEHSSCDKPSHQETLRFNSAVATADGTIKWVSDQIRVNVYDSTRNEISLIKTLLNSSKLLPSGGSPPFGGVLTVTRKQWNDWRERQGSLYARHSIHIVASGEDPPLIQGLNTPSWEELASLSYLDVFSYRAAHDHLIELSPDQSVADRMRRLTLQTFFRNMKRRDESGVPFLANCLDIATDSTCFPLPVNPLADGNQLVYMKHEGISWQTSMDGTKPMNWAIVSTKDVTSDIHIDATGLGTRVYVVKGVKLWFVGIGDHIPHPIEGWEANGIWTLVVLYPGDEFFLQPGRRHAVLSGEDSLIVGSHFYSRHTFSHSLYALTMEHYFNHISNAAHAPFMLMLCKILADCLQRTISVAQGEDQSERTDIPAGFTSEQIAYLVTVVAYMDQLQPLSRYEEVNGGLQALDEGWSVDQLASDHRTAMVLVARMKDALRDNESFLSDLLEAENALVLWSASCLQTRNQHPVTDVPTPSTLAIQCKDISQLRGQVTPLPSKNGITKDVSGFSKGSMRSSVSGF